jgi:hypothetical protein
MSKMNLTLWCPVFKYQHIFQLSKWYKEINNLVFWLDFEWRGKKERQLNWKRKPLDLMDIRRFKEDSENKLSGIRVNPIIYPETLSELELVMELEYEYAILPYFHTVEEVELFLKILRGSGVKPILLVETKDAFQLLPELIQLEDVWAYHLGLYDLSMDLGKDFLLDLYLDGTVDKFVDLNLWHL